MERRTFLQSLGATLLTLPLEGALQPLAGAAAAPHFGRFDPIAPSDRDELLLPEGFLHDVVIKWGDPFTAKDEPFGYNNDFIGVLRMNGDEEALLVVNHEYVSMAFGGDAALYPQTFRALRGREPTIDDVKYDVGLSVLRVQRDGATGAWKPVLRDRLNRRITARTPCAVDGPAARLIGGDRVEGTFDNCAGQVTPWGTALSSEENIQTRVPEAVDGKGNSERGGSFDLPGGHYGWIVEVDPFDPDSVPVKHTALGRFRHENAALRAEAGRPVAAYMGDDRVGGHVWKFVSHDLYRPADGASNRRLLASGTLFVARFRADGTGEWRPLELATPLDPSRSPADPKPVIPPYAKRLADCYDSLGAVLMDAYQAANAIGGTPSGRPEDVEVHPGDGSVYVAFTSQDLRPGGLWENPYGQVFRIEERGGDVRARRFRWSRFAVGGPADPALGGRVFAHPDNLLFDARGDLWMTCDIGGNLINGEGPYSVFKNSGLFYVPVSGPERGRARQFASMPCEAEPTGPAFAPGHDALFLSVQHPGERHGTRTDAAQAPRGSNWPHDKVGAPPQPAVVAMRRR
jgi:uncharacterized protein